MRVYFDSSAFVKRYINEPGTAQVLVWCDQASELALSVIAIPELISAFCRLKREGKLSAGQYRRLKSDLMADIADALICDTTPQMIQQSVQALERHPLRGMDAIHLGAAVVSAADAFISADQRQCAAAEAMGLRVIAL
jgi:predicted nucleic acid-binding protein